jgi:hypothetical protein
MVVAPNHQVLFIFIGFSFPKKNHQAIGVRGYPPFPTTSSPSQWVEESSVCPTAQSLSQIRRLEISAERPGQVHLEVACWGSSDSHLGLNIGVLFRQLKWLERW